jgi:FAD synthase
MHYYYRVGYQKHHQFISSRTADFQKRLFNVGPVMNGYGRGSKKLGVPTANLPHFDKEIRESALSHGVYFGWGYLPNEREISGCVVNIGRSPTFVDQVAAA